LYLWRENAFDHERMPGSNADRVVDYEHVNRRSPDGSLADQNRTVPPKMHRPFVQTRVEEPYDPAGLDIYSREIWPLKRVAVAAASGKVRGDRRSAVLARNNVIDFERNAGVFARELTILAPLLPPSPNELLQGVIHELCSQASFLERVACPGAHYVEDAADSSVTIEVGLILRGERTILRLERQLVHSSAVFIREVGFEPSSGSGNRKRPVVPLKDSAPNGRLTRLEFTLS
jgi:hypothetical protein